MSDTSGSEDICAIDDRGIQQHYLIQRLRVRRRMAILAFAQLLIGGACIIAGGLIVPAWSVRVDHMATFLSIYFGALATIVGAYWGIGMMEHNATMAASRFGGYGDTSGMRPRLVKQTTKTSVEVESDPTPHRSPDGE